MCIKVSGEKSRVVKRQRECRLSSSGVEPKPIFKGSG